MAKADKSKPNIPQYVRSSAKVHPDFDADPNSYSVEKFKLYETRQRFYLIGSDRNKRFFRVLKIDRSEPDDLNISEDPVVYSPQEIKSLLQRISEGNRATGGLTFVVKVFGIAGQCLRPQFYNQRLRNFSKDSAFKWKDEYRLEYRMLGKSLLLVCLYLLLVWGFGVLVGCIKFLESYYLILVTKRRQIGSICGHAIYSIDESQLITIPHVSIQTDVAHSKTELRYKNLLSSVDLTKDFFYSYTYPIMQRLQKNVLSMGEEGMPYDNIFVWNAYLTQTIRSRCNNTIWTIALVHGHFKQIRLSIFGRDFSVSLVSRRSRHFAGTRYLKRGVNDRGRVANDVETEQIILDEEAGSCKGKMSSVVQMRGSIPLFWSQEASRFSPKPDIILQRYDPTYEATKLHFEDLAMRYGNPVIVLNLIKTVEKRPREMMLRREFASAVGYLNQIFSEENHLKFIHWDFHKFAKSKSANVLAVLGAVASEALDLTGFYYSGKPSVVKRRLNQLSRTSTGREASLRDLRANAGDVPRFGSRNETLNSSVNRDRESDIIQQKKNDNFSGEPPHFQSGVLRTNCIDCLDRTNVAQYAYGLAALGRQLHAMGLTNLPKVDPDSTIAAALMDMYQSMGDALAQQYGGSAAHNTVFPERQGKWKATTQSREFLKSIKRYYSNAYTDGEKQDAINLFLGYFKPQEGKPALWELDSDYYLHVSGIDDPLFDVCSQGNDTRLGGMGDTLAPIPACREDFLRMKLTSFDKLIERTCSSIRDVRLCSEPDQRPGGGTANSSVAPDAAEIQLKSPNWLFGQRKYVESGTAPKVTSHEISNGGSHNETGVEGFCDLNWLSSEANDNEEDIFQRYPSMTSVYEANGWYGGTLLGDQDERSEIYKHYAELCQGPGIEPFENDGEMEKHYADALHMGTINIVDDAAVEVEMEAALKEYDQIGSDFGSIPASCKSLAEDPSWLTRWIIGEEKVERI